MKIAVSYDQGKVFQHFGHSEEFKIYEVQGGKIVGSEIVKAEGSGHNAMADFLKNSQIDVVLCGGLGGGAESALTEAGIVSCSGVEGDADQAVADYLAGKLESAGVNCDHHGHDDEGSCGGCASDEGCGGCGGCGSQEPAILYDGPNAGRKVKTHYTGTMNNGRIFDSSYDRGEPLEFIAGVGMMIPGFDKAVVNMKPGDVVDIHLTPDEAYGDRDPKLVLNVPHSQMRGTESLKVGDQVYLQNHYGRQFPVLVIANDEETITFDANHELAGQELNFKIELLSVE